ncbi:MAG: ATP-binding cassette domain-containing protein [Deltaproteobacteria bacterium]|nr:ATP-binding cassette domain-containing protein [Deltaproteobacteria bacterium]
MIRTVGLGKSFGQPVLRGLDLVVPKGTLYGLIGPGASGKSVVLKLLAGLVRPDVGQIFIEGQDTTKMGELALQKVRAGIGFQFQNNALFDYLNVGDNIAFPLRRLTSAGADEIRQRVAERLARVSLPGFEPRMPGGLSGGQRKRVGIARATITQSPLVLFDEPAAGLDPVTSRKIFDLIRDEQRATGATAVVVSSDLDNLLATVDRVGMILRGALVFDGTPDEARAATSPAVRQFVHGLTEGPL